MDKQKGWLLDALVLLGTAQADAILEKQRGSEEKCVPDDLTVKDVDETVQEIQKWCDLTDSKVCLFLVS